MATASVAPRTSAATWVVRVAFSVLLFAGGCASLRRPDPPVDRSQDDRILSEVRARLEAEPAMDASRIRVEVDGAIVLLYGSVEGIALWQCVIRNAELVDGVVTVVDYLVIARGPRDARCIAAPGAPSTTPGPQSASPRDPRAGGNLPLRHSTPAATNAVIPMIASDFPGSHRPSRLAGEFSR